MKKGRAALRSLAAGLLLALAMTIGFAGSAVAADVRTTQITEGQAGESRAQISWKSVKGAKNYKIYAKKGTGQKLLLKTRSAARETTLKIKNLKNNVKYTFYVSVVDKNGKEGKKSAGYSLTPTVIKPDKVEGLSVTKVTKTTATLTWNAAKYATGYIITQRKSDGTYKELARTTSTSIKLKNLKEGKSYEVGVRAYRRANGSSNRGYLSQTAWIIPQTVTAQLAGIHTYNAPSYATDSSIVYSRQVAEAYVNTATGYGGNRFASATDWLVWVNTYTQHMYIFTGSYGSWRLQKVYTCSTGARGTLTPLCVTPIYGKSPVWKFSSIQWAYWASYIISGAIHSELYYPNGAKWTGMGVLGSIASHGCVRLPIEGAKYVYDNVPVGTYVWIW